ncbi:sensor domain-containing diguanylate cyclase [Bacillus timonensis]|nr:sensor domain-containing diguanylate cyclase [Bacillus timonensis]
MMNYKGRLIGLLIAVLQSFYWIYQETKESNEMSIVLIVFLTFYCLLSWWVGKQFDHNNYLAKSLQLAKKSWEEQNTVLKESENKYEFLFEHANDCIFLFELDEKEQPGLYIEVNNKAIQTLGYTKEEFLSMSPKDITIKERISKIPNISQELASKGNITFEGGYLSKEGEYIPFEFSAQTAMVNNKKVVVAVARDIRERQKTEALIKHMAFHDPLTNLPNRRYFYDRLDEIILKAKEDNGFQVAVFYLDLDGFKEVNDQYGHELGDEIIIQVTRRISNCIRESDTFARLGGDEFTVLLSDISNEEVERIAKRIIEKVKQPFKVQDLMIDISTSIGISYLSSQLDNGKVLVHQADLAMYEAKVNGKNKYYIYSEDMQCEKHSL